MERPARLLLGWLDEDGAARLLASRLAQEGTRRDELAAAISRARACVAARAPRHDDSGAIREAPDTFARRLVEDGAKVKLVHLRSLRALQPYVFTDTPPLTAHGASLDELAAVTLPDVFDQVPDVQHDTATTLRVTSRSQNLQVLGDFVGPVPGAPPGVVGVGFLVGVAPSLVRVRVVDGRAVLVDGYHRCVALLAAGVGEVPALVSGTAPAGGDGSDGMLPERVYMGPRAPYVADYLDDVVAASVVLRHVGRKIIVRAEESDAIPSDVLEVTRGELGLGGPE